MKLLASSKLLCALLAVVAVGMGVQTYYLIQVHRQLGTSEVRAAETAASTALSTGANAAEAEQARASIPSDPQAPRVPADPFADLDRAEKRLRGLFDGFYDRFDRHFGEAWFDHPPFYADGDSFLSGMAGTLGPRMDLRDLGDRYELTVDVPGAEETDVVVRTEDGVLTVEGSRATTTEETAPGSFVRRERQFGRFERRLALPQDAEASTLRTEFENGVLKVTLDKQG